MTGLPNHFYITLFSSASRKIYTQNKLYAFTVKLVRLIGLDPKENWEVGICEISCSPPNVGNLRPLLVVGETSVLICCNLISPQFVGDQTARCLRTFIFPSKHCRRMFTEVFLCTSRTMEFSRHPHRLPDTRGQESPI